MKTLSWKTIVSAALLGSTVLFSCKEEGTGPNPPIPPEPVIQYLGMSTEIVTALEDPVVIQVKYTDGDGDIGFEEADSAVVYLTDLRFPLTEQYHVPPLAPIGSNIAITGVLDIIIDRTILADPTSSEEQASFQIELRDRSGNYSNTILTPPLTVIP
jgi:hypothetical protein